MVQNNITDSQDWEKNEIILKKGRRTKNILKITKETLANLMKPMLG